MPEESKGPSVEFISLTKFGWDQQGGKIKVYITSGIDGVGNIPKDQIACEFTDTSVDLQIYGLNGNNYRLRIPELQYTVDIAKCKYNVKSNGINITLAKEKPAEHWTDLKPKKSLLSDKTKKATSDKTDAMGNIMGMMKDMYENGDDD